MLLPAASAASSPRRLLALCKALAACFVPAAASVFFCVATRPHPVSSSLATRGLCSQPPALPLLSALTGRTCVCASRPPTRSCADATHVGDDPVKLARFHAIQEASDALTKGRADYDKSIENQELNEMVRAPSRPRLVCPRARCAPVRAVIRRAVVTLGREE
eukprot:1350410-Rhodomonas_salina.1